MARKIFLEINNVSNLLIFFVGGSVIKMRVFIKASMLGIPETEVASFQSALNNRKRIL